MKKMTSSTTEIIDLIDFLKSNRNSPSRLDSILHVSTKSQQKSVKQCFCLIKCDKDDVREDDFIDFLFLSIVKYALTYSETHPKKLNEKQITEWWIENCSRLTSSAKGSFLTKAETTGELGELFLFVALEDLGFIRLINKMSLKTSSNIPFQGWDAVHLGFDEDDNLLFCLGSSKMYKEFSGALYETFKEIEDFTIIKKKQENEVKLISSYMDSDRFGKFAEVIPKILSPYYSNKAKIGQAHPIFLGYEWAVLNNLEPPEHVTLDEHVCAEYEKKHKKIMSQITKKISKLSAASNQYFLFWIMPFKNVEDMRLKFLKKLKAP
jgi:hypothetical protein